MPTISTQTLKPLYACTRACASVLPCLCNKDGHGVACMLLYVRQGKWHLRSADIPYQCLRSGTHCLCGQALRFASHSIMHTCNAHASTHPPLLKASQWRLMIMMRMTQLPYKAPSSILRCESRSCETSIDSIILHWRMDPPWRKTCPKSAKARGWRRFLVKQRPGCSASLRCHY